MNGNAKSIRHGSFWTSRRCLRTAMPALGALSALVLVRADLLLIAKYAPVAPTDAVAIVVLRQVIRDNGGLMRGCPYLVQVNDADPDAVVLAALRADSDKVEPYSEAKMPEHGLGLVLDRRSGEAGIVVHAEHVHVVGVWQDRATAEGGYYCDGLCAGTDMFTLTREGQSWRIVHVDIGPRA